MVTPAEGAGASGGGGAVVHSYLSGTDGTGGGGGRSGGANRVKGHEDEVQSRSRPAAAGHRRSESGMTEMTESTAYTNISAQSTNTQRARHHRTSSRRLSIQDDTMALEDKLQAKLNRERLKAEKKAERKAHRDAYKLAYKQELERLEQERVDTARTCMAVLEDFQSRLAVQLETMLKSDYLATQTNVSKGGSFGAVSSSKWLHFPRGSELYREYLTGLFDRRVWGNKDSCEMMSFLLIAWSPCYGTSQFQLRSEAHYRMVVLLEERGMRRGTNGLQERFNPANVPSSAKMHSERATELQESPFSFETFLQKISFFRELKPASWDVAYYEVVEAIVDLVIADALVVCMEHFSIEVSPATRRKFLELAFHMMERRKPLNLENQLFEMLTGDTRRQWVRIIHRLTLLPSLWADVVFTLRDMCNVGPNASGGYKMKASTFIMYAQILNGVFIHNDDDLYELLVLLQQLTKKYNGNVQAMLCIYQIMHNAVMHAHHYTVYSRVTASESQVKVWGNLAQLWIFCHHRMRYDRPFPHPEYRSLMSLCITIIIRSPHFFWSKQIGGFVNTICSMLDNVDSEARLVGLEGILKLLRGKYRPRTMLPGWDAEWLRALVQHRVQPEERLHVSEVGCRLVPHPTLRRIGKQHAKGAARGSALAVSRAPNAKRDTQGDGEETDVANDGADDGMVPEGPGTDLQPGGNGMNVEGAVDDISDIVTTPRWTEGGSIISESEAAANDHGYLYQEHHTPPCSEEEVMDMDVYRHWEGGITTRRDPHVFMYVMREDMEPVKFRSLLYRIVDRVLLSRKVRLSGDMSEEVNMLLDICLQVAANDIDMVINTVLPFLFAQVSNEEALASSGLLAQSGNALPVHLGVGIDVAQSLVDPNVGFQRCAAHSMHVKAHEQAYKHVYETMPQKLIEFLQLVTERCEKEIGIGKLGGAPWYVPLVAHDGTDLPFWRWIRHTIKKEFEIAADTAEASHNEIEKELTEFRDIIEKTLHSFRSGRRYLRGTSRAVDAIAKLHARKTVSKDLDWKSTANLENIIGHSTETETQKEERRMHHLVNLMFYGPQSESLHYLRKHSTDFVTYHGLGDFWAHHTSDAPVVEPAVEVRHWKSMSVVYSEAMHDKGLLFQLYRSALMSFSNIFPDYLFESVVKGGGDVTMLLALVHRNTEIARVASTSLQKLVINQPARRTIVYKAFVNLLVLSDLPAPAIATILTNLARMLELWAKDLVKVDTNEDADQGELLQPQDLWLGKLEAACMIYLCDPHASVRVTAVHVLHQVRVLADAFNIYTARLRLSLSEENRDMLEEIHEKKMQEIVDSLTMFRVADLLDERWPETLRLGCIYLKTNHVSSLHPSLQIVERENQKDVYHLATFAHNPLWQCIVTAIGYLIVEQGTCQVLLHDLRVLLLQLLAVRVKPPAKSLNDITSRAGQMYQLWVNYCSLLLSTCGVLEGKEDLNKKQLTEKRLAHRELNKIVSQCRSNLTKKYGKKLTPKAERELGTAVWTKMGANMYHSFFEIRCIINRVIDQTMLEGLRSKISWVQQGVALICSSCHWHAMGDVVDAILAWYNDNQKVYPQEFERRNVRPVICRIFRCMLDRPGSVLQLRQSKTTLASLLSFMRASEQTLLRIDRVEPFKTPYLYRFDYHLDHILMVELISAAFASGALLGVHVRGENERIEHLKRDKQTMALVRRRKLLPTEFLGDADASTENGNGHGERGSVQDDSGDEDGEEDEEDDDDEDEDHHPSSNNGKKKKRVDTGKVTPLEDFETRLEDPKSGRHTIMGSLELELETLRLACEHARSLLENPIIRISKYDVAHTNRACYALPLNMILKGGIGQAISLGDLPVAGDSFDESDTANMGFMLANCDKIAWPSYERFRTLMSLRQWVTYAKAGRHRIELLVGSPGNINFATDEQLVTMVMLLQLKVERTMFLILSLGPCIPPTVSPKKTLEFYLNPESRGMRGFTQTLLRFHSNQLLPCCLKQVVDGSPRESFFYSNSVLGHALEKMEYLSDLLRRAPYDDVMANNHMLNMEQGLLQDPVPAHDMSLHDLHFADHVLRFDPQDRRKDFHVERAHILRRMRPTKRRASLLQMGTVHILFRHSFSDWMNLWLKELHAYGGIFLYWALMLLTHPSKAYSPQASSIILLIYNIYSDIPREREGYMCDNAHMSVPEFIETFSELIAPVEDLEPTDLLFRRFEGDDYAQIKALRRQKPGEFYDDFSAVLEDVWEPIQGSWLQMSGNLACMSKRKGDITWIGPKPGWKDFTMEVRMRVEPGGLRDCTAGVLFRASGTSGFKAPESYYSLLLNVMESTCTLSRNTLDEAGNIVTQQMRSASYRRSGASSSKMIEHLMRYEFVNIGITCEGNSIKVQIDGNELLNERDDEASCPTGSVGFLANETEMKVAHIDMKFLNLYDEHDPEAELPENENENEGVTLEDIEAQIRKEAEQHALEKEQQKIHFVDGRSDDVSSYTEAIETISAGSTQRSISDFTDNSMAMTEVAAMALIEEDNNKNRLFGASMDTQTRENTRLKEQDRIRKLQYEREEAARNRKEMQKKERLAERKRAKLASRKLEEKRRKERFEVTESIEKICYLIASVAPAICPSLFMEVVTSFIEHDDALLREGQLLHVKILIPFAKYVYLTSEVYKDKAPVDPRFSETHYEVSADFILPPLLSFTCEVSEAGMPKSIEMFWRYMALAYPPPKPNKKPHNLDLILLQMQEQLRIAPQGLIRVYEGILWFFRSLDNSRNRRANGGEENEDEEDEEDEEIHI